MFVSHCLAEAGWVPSNDARAISYATYGRPAKFTPGAILVLRRRSKGADTRTGSSSGNHVCFLLEVKKHYYRVVGGNQGDAVSIASFSKKRYEVVAIRQPWQRAA